MTTTAQRKSSKPGEQDAPRIERVNGTWRIRSTEGVRQVFPGSAVGGQMDRLNWRVD